jgi:hypothetical protein
MQVRHDTFVLGILIGLLAAGCATHRTSEPRLALLSETNAEPGSTYDLTVYIVAKGDSLARIAKQFRTTIREILNLNPNMDRPRLAIGQAIRVYQRRRE